MAHKQIYYSDKYFDENYEYRHVMLPRELSKQVPKTHLMTEEEWRRLGVQQSLGWVHYMIHEPVDLIDTSGATNGESGRPWNCGARGAPSLPPKGSLDVQSLDGRNPPAARSIWIPM
ncbi:hypothetical protein JRQ81_013560 [Phrynocephalus forsythii]|uniref:Cyclin-dependent kinases regulatory subunit n=1 Tax=Phrynocephalus forsythii TaxID=171643 RepID=A0A9Q0Y231_9SAUR|nr:hypothetical protein JRQ81_013560 [Phrynocephalus forsythii]